jgi:meso-butanediol dehydrogenase / (S,S)-butanediol dehydrogenase / diacetyl reductase
MPTQSDGVVVVGAASGIGWAIVQRFAGEGARLFLIDVAADALARVDDELRRSGMPACGTATCDIADADAVAEAFASASRCLERFDVMVNAAGITRFRPFVDITPAEWRLIIDVNLNGAFFCSQAAARAMLGAGGGVIINIASLAGLQGEVLIAPYAAAKAALLNLTRTMARELAPFIRVNAVCPGEVTTPMMQQHVSYFASRAGETEEQQRDRMLANIPLRRFQTPENIASAVRFLCSDDASEITGQALVVDGGTLA